MKKLSDEKSKIEKELEQSKFTLEKVKKEKDVVKAKLQQTESKLETTSDMSKGQDDLIMILEKDALEAEFKLKKYLILTIF